MKQTMRDFLLELLSMRKDRGYRMGLIQGFRSCGAITQGEWCELKKQIKKGTP